MSFSEDFAMGSNVIDLTGQTFGRWKVLRRSDHRGGEARWVVQCGCKTATTKEVRGSVLRDGRSKSCGCLKTEGLVERSTKHGHCAGGNFSPTWWSWSGMVARCTDPTNDRYVEYGGAGIKVCDRWLGEDGFVNFLADMGERPDGTTIDRHPNRKGNYEPANCRWGTDEEQANNKSNNTLLTHKGRTQTIAQWARELGIPQSTISWRHNNGRTDEECLRP